MKKIVPLLMLVAVAACGREPAPTLPEGAAVKSFSFVDDSLLRGLRSDSPAYLENRPPLLLDVTYQLRCLDTADRRAEARFAQAKVLLDRKFIEAPLMFLNTREESQWSYAADETIVNQTGCEVNRIDFAEKTRDPLTVLKYIVDHGIRPSR